MTDVVNGMNSQPNLVAKYSVPKTQFQRVEDSLLTFYLWAGLSPASSGLFGTLIWLVAVLSDKAPLLGVLNVPVGIAFGISVLLTYIWLMMTPIAFLALLWRRKFRAVVPVLLYVAWCGFSYALTQIGWINSMVSQTAGLLSFAVVAFVAVKIQRQELRQLRAESKFRHPTVLGCGRESHLLPKLPE